MSIKTCVVIGHFSLGTNIGNIFESEVFGPDCRHPTAKSFIDEIVNMHRKSGSVWKIEKVIIG